jgi:translation initiation factor IF-3
MDYGKFKYEEKKKKKAKHQHQHELKEIRLRPRTDEHDLQTKLKHAKGFLEEGHKVLFTVFFRGREQAHKEFGRALMERIAREMEEVGKVEHDVSQMGPRMHMTLMPKAPGAKPKQPAKPAPPGGGAPAAPPAPAAPASPPPTPAPPAPAATPDPEQKKGA